MFVQYNSLISIMKRLVWFKFEMSVYICLDTSPKDFQHNMGETIVWPARFVDIAVL